ncbi:MAG: phage tail protein [Gorillibacterium sp.]|nr:phage tail protein [Gorillibacterium sp.]
MAIASFQKKVFMVSASKRYPFVGLEWSSSLETEPKDKIKNKPSTYIKGEGLGSMSFDIPLRIDSKIDVRLEIEQWEAIKSKAIADYFILGTKALGNMKWLLKSVGVSDTEIDSKGRLLKALLKLSFEEFVGVGESSESTSKSPPALAGSATASTGNPGMVPDSYIDKTSERRVNANAKAAIITRLAGKPYEDGR